MHKSILKRLVFSTIFHSFSSSSSASARVVIYSPVGMTSFVRAANTLVQFASSLSPVLAKLHAHACPCKWEDLVTARTHAMRSKSSPLIYVATIWDLPWACPTTAAWLQHVWGIYESHLPTNIASVSPKFDSIVSIRVTYLRYSVQLCPLLC